MQQRILVIEDNPADAAIIHIYFEETAFGHTIYQAESLKRGFDILREHPIDLVLLDLTLTDSFGFNTVEKFLAEFPNVPVIVMTGLNNEILGVQCVRAGAQDFLVKGEFDSRGLVKSIRHALQRFQTQTKLQESAQKLSQQQKRLQEAQELANFSNWEMDVVSNAMKWGEEMYRILGRPHTDASLSLADYLQFVFFDDKEAVELFFTTALQAEEIQKIEHRIVVGTRVKHIELRAKVQIDQDSGKVLLIGSAQDISEEMAPILSAGSSRSSTELWRKEVLSELKGLIQKPLFVAIDLAHLLQKTASPAQQELLPEFRSGLKEVLLAVDTLLMAQSDLRNAAAQEYSTFSSASFFAHFQENAEMQGAKAGCKVELIIPSDFPKTLMGNESALMLLVDSFFKCALAEKSRPAAIVMHINLIKNPGDRPAMKISYLPNEKRMPADMLKSLLDSADFSLVSTPELRRKATILAVAGQLLKALNGNYTLRKDEKGLCESFDLIVPVQIPASDLVEAAGSTSGLPIAPSFLIVDDAPLHRLANRKAVTTLMPDAKVDFANDGQAAVSMVGQRKFDFILLDLQMPDLNGFDTLAALEKHHQAHVIALTSAASPEEKDLCMSKGFSGYVSKPIQTDLLSSEISRIIKT